MNGREMIASERLRQISTERFTHAHDDRHPEGQLVAAADCYAFLTHSIEAPHDMEGLLWPWHPSWFKPSPDPRRNLVKAGALYVAEAERFKRSGKLDQADRCMNFAAQLAQWIDDM